MTKAEATARAAYPHTLPCRVSYAEGYEKALSDVKDEIDRLTAALTARCRPDPLGTTVQMLASAETEALGLIREFIEEQTKEQ